MPRPGHGPRYGDAELQPRPDLEQTARVLQRLARRRALRRWAPLLCALVAVLLAAYFAHPRNWEFERFGRQARPQTPSLDASTAMSEDGVLDLGVKEGGGERRLRLHKGAQGWVVEEYPEGSQPPPLAPDPADKSASHLKTQPRSPAP